MRIVFKYMPIAILIIQVISVISCGDDEEESISNNHVEYDYTLVASGELSVYNEDGTLLYVSRVKNAGYIIWTTDLSMSDATISFKAVLYPNNGLNTSEKLTSISLNPPAGDYLSIGKISNSGEIEFTHYHYNRQGYYEEITNIKWFDGEVAIESIETNRYITLVFSNCRNIISPKVIFNGKIKFPIRKKEFFM